MGGFNNNYGCYELNGNGAIVTVFLVALFTIVIGLPAVLFPLDGIVAAKRNYSSLLSELSFRAFLTSPPTEE